MAEFTFLSSLMLDLPRDEVFPFFSDAENLERITPSQLNFHINTPTPIDLKKGTTIDYKLSMHGFPMNWSSEITLWNPPFEFEDTQLRGPYKQWIHRHRFTEPEPGKTLIVDEVRYRLPLEPIGDLAQFLINIQLKYIFEHRNKTVTGILAPKSLTQAS